MIETPTLAPQIEATAVESYWDRVRQDAIHHMTKFAEQQGAEMNLEPAYDGPSYNFYFVVQNIPFADGIGHGTLRVMGYEYCGIPHLMAKFRTNRKYKGYDLNPDRGAVIGEHYDFCRRYPVGTVPNARQYADIIKGVVHALNFQKRDAERTIEKGVERRFINSSVEVHPKYTKPGEFIGP